MDGPARRRGLAHVCARWSRFYTCLAGTAPRGVRFPRMGSGSLVRGGPAARASCPRNNHRRAETDVARSPLARGSRRLLFTKVNKSHRQSNIFSQHKKRCHSAIVQPARVDAPGRAIFQSITRRRDCASARSACPKGNSGLHLSFEAFRRRVRANALSKE